MDWIFDHFQIVLLIALALGTWVKRRMDMKRTEQDERQAREEMAGGDDVFGPDSGWPQPQRQAEPAAPPPIVRPSPPPLRPPTVPTAMPVELYDTAAQLRRQQDLQERLRQIRASKTPATGGATKATTTGGAAATRTRVSAAQHHVSTAQHAKPGLPGSLRSRKEIRHAILMREILGPPVGLR
jgi:hypothetical protein